MSENKFSKKELNRFWLSWMQHCACGYNYARMMGSGVAHVMRLPIQKSVSYTHLFQREAQEHGIVPEHDWNVYNTKELALNLGRNAGLAGIHVAILTTGFDVVSKAVQGETIDADETVELALRSGADAGIKAAAAGALKAGAEKGLICLLYTSKTFRRDELEELLRNLIEITEWQDRKSVCQMIEQKWNHYDGESTGKASLKIQWDLERCILKRKIIILDYRDEDAPVKKRVKPMEIGYDNGYAYLVAYDCDGEMRCPVSFRLDRIDSFKVENGTWSEKEVGGDKHGEND